jgi:hypothetical protein
VPSVTSELKESGSPLRLILMPHEELVSRMRKRVTASLSGQPWLRPAKPGWASMAGHAIDYRARWMLVGVDTLPEIVVQSIKMGLCAPETAAVLVEAFESIRGLPPGPHPDREGDIARVAVAAATIEPLFRAGAGLPCPLDGVDFATFTDTYAPVVDDVVAMTERLHSLLPPVTDASLVQCGPVVATGRLAGDADLLIDGHLIEMKAVSDPRDSAARALRQLLVYSARLRPSRASLLLPRQHTIVTFDMQQHAQLLEQLDTEIQAMYGTANVSPPPMRQPAHAKQESNHE